MDKKTKAAARRFLAIFEWLFLGDDKFDCPGIFQIIGFASGVLLVILTAPVWLPFWLLGRWSGYEWRN